ncbi:hypothetical protein JCM8097_005035 [Rhodosporidiobolus ruineniae]
MLRALRPHRLAPTLLRRTHSCATHLSTPSPPPPSSPPDALAVDDLCVPLRPPYSIQDYLPTASSAPKLSRETLLKLHRLAALEPPSSEQGWTDLEDLNELVAIVQAVRDVDTSSLGLKQGEMVDARVRAEAEPVDWDSKRAPLEPVEEGQELLKLAPRTEGAYFVAPLPENVKRRKKRASSSEEESLAEEY